MTKCSPDVEELGTCTLKNTNHNLSQDMLVERVSGMQDYRIHLEA